MNRLWRRLAALALAAAVRARRDLGAAAFGCTADDLRPAGATAAVTVANSSMAMS